MPVSILCRGGPTRLVSFEQILRGVLEQQGRIELVGFLLRQKSNSLQGRHDDLLCVPPILVGCINLPKIEDELARSQLRVRMKLVGSPSRRI